MFDTVTRAGKDVRFWYSIEAALLGGLSQSLFVLSVIRPPAAPSGFCFYDDGKRLRLVVSLLLFFLTIYSPTGRLLSIPPVLFFLYFRVFVRLSTEFRMTASSSVRPRL